jgi:hypothetical protein
MPVQAVPLRSGFAPAFLYVDQPCVFIKYVPHKLLSDVRLIQLNESICSLRL